MIKTVIFDIDGTMYDYAEGNRLGIEAVKEYCIRNLGITEDIFQQVLEQSRQKRETVLGLENAAVHNRLLRYQCMLELLDMPIFPHVQAMCRIYWDSLLDSMEPQPGLKELLAELKSRGIRVGAGTNMTAWMQFEKLERMGVTPWIDWLVTSEEAGIQKPAPGFYEYCLTKARCGAGECMFIGDSLEGDVKGPLRHGMKALWYHPGKLNDTEEDGRYPCIRSFSDFFALKL